MKMRWWAGVLAALIMMAVHGRAVADTYSIAAFSGAAVTEHTGTVTLTVQLDKPVAVGDTVQFAVTTAGTATAGSDYTPPAASLTINPGEDNGTITVALADDHLVESTENIVVSLAGDPASNAAGLNQSATITIADDGDTYAVSGFSGVTVSEDGGNANLIVQLNQPVRTGDTVVLDVSHTAGTAAAGSDYTAPASTLTINGDGSVTSGTISVPIINDNLVETAEQFSVGIGANSANVTTAGYTSATVTINVDEKYTIKFINATLEEPSGTPANMPFTVTVTPAVQAQHNGLTFKWRTYGGSAVSGNDFAYTTDQFTLATGDTTLGPANVPVNPDTEDESAEYFYAGPISGGTLPVTVCNFALQPGRSPTMIIVSSPVGIPTAL
jgi:Calx-beta domain.